MNKIFYSSNNYGNSITNSNTSEIEEILTEVLQTNEKLNNQIQDLNNKVSNLTDQVNAYKNFAQKIVFEPILDFFLNKIESADDNSSDDDDNISADDNISNDDDNISINSEDSDSSVEFTYLGTDGYHVGRHVNTKDHMNVQYNSNAQSNSDITFEEIVDEAVEIAGELVDCALEVTEDIVEGAVYIAAQVYEVIQDLFNTAMENISDMYEEIQKQINEGDFTTLNEFADIALDCAKLAVSVAGISMIAAGVFSLIINIATPITIAAIIDVALFAGMITVLGESVVILDNIHTQICRDSEGNFTLDETKMTFKNSDEFYEKLFRDTLFGDTYTSIAKFAEKEFNEFMTA